MAQEANSFDTYDAVGNREDLENVIYRITPEETPFISMIGTTKVSSVRHDWQIDELATPNASNAQVEGFEYSYTDATPTDRVANYSQISDKDAIVSETNDAVAKAGRSKDLAYLVAKKGVELRKDIEAVCLSNQASVAGSSSVARKLGGFPAWLTTNATRQAGGSDGGFNASTGLVVAATNGNAQAAFTKAMLDDTIQLTYEAGGNPTTLMVSPYNKRAFSGFMSDSDVAAFRMAASNRKQGTIMAAADAYVSDFGVIDVVPNRVMGTSASLGRNAFLITPDMVSRGVLRPITQDIPAKTGDNNKRILKTEYTLVVKNEAAHGVIADLTTSGS